jgi:large subunit ribosomal protein L30
MAKLKIKQIKSYIGYEKYQEATLKSLGLRKIGQTVIKDDKPEFRGMIKTVRHLVSVEEI